jgi:glucokinase
VLFGGLAKSGDMLMRPLVEAFEKNNMPIHSGKIKILLSGLKEADAAILGASALGWG